MRGSEEGLVSVDTLYTRTPSRYTASVLAGRSRMATELIATGTGAANSADITVAAGAVLGIALKGVSGGQTGPGKRCILYFKDDAGAYNAIDFLGDQQPSLAIIAPGTYRVSRLPGVTCGVFNG